MIYVISFIFFASYTGAVGIQVDELGAVDCARFNGLGRAAGGVVELRYHGRKNGGCFLYVNENKMKPQDRKIVGFGGAKIFIISTTETVKNLRRFVGQKGSLETTKFYKNTSLNERQFKLPVLRVDCAARSSPCTISVAQAAI